MSRDYEDLSRLLDGELGPAEAEVMRARIAAEPRLAAAWERLQALPAELADLPDELPPPGLDDRVLGRVRSPVRWPMWIAPAALAAAVLLGVGLRPDADRIVLVAGEQVVEGRVEVLAGALPVQVDGLARILVEPAPGVARGRGGEEDTMKSILAGTAGALVGAAVTVAVVVGEATIDPGDGAPIVVVAGDTRTISSGGTAGGAGMRQEPRPEIPAGATPAQRIALLEAEVADLRGQLAEAEFTGAVAKGQLLAEQGEPVAWPDRYPDPMHPDAFEATLRAKVAEIPGLAVHDIDCSEFPCIATLRATDLSDGWKERLNGLPVALSPDSQPETGVWMSVSASNDGETKSGTVGIALVPEGAGEEVSQRTDWRAKALMDEAAHPEP